MKNNWNARCLRPARRLWRWLGNWHELLGLPIGLGLFWLSAAGARWVDPTAATYDWGLFQAAVWAVAVLVFTKAAAWLLLRLDFPEVYRYLDERLGQGICGPWAPWIGLAYYGLHLAALLILTVAML